MAGKPSDQELDQVLLHHGQDHRDNIFQQTGIIAVELIRIDWMLYSRLFDALLKHTLDLSLQPAL